MTVAVCRLCRWYEGNYWEPDDDFPAKGRCDYPAARMPLSFQGYAQRERELVEANAAGCPTFSISCDPVGTR